MGMCGVWVERELAEAATPKDLGALGLEDFCFCPSCHFSLGVVYVGEA